MSKGIEYLISKSKHLIKPLISKSVEVGLYSTTKDPYFSAITAELSDAILHKLFGNLSGDFADRSLSNQEVEKIGATLAFAVMEIKENFGNKKSLREDNFFNLDEFKRSPYDEIGEGVYIKVKDEFELKKLKYYGNFLANIAFSEEVSKEEANKLLLLIDSLTYRQLKLLALVTSSGLYSPGIESKEIYEIIKSIGAEFMDLQIPEMWKLPDIDFTQGGMGGYSTISIYQDLLDLMRLGLIMQQTNGNIEIILDITNINPSRLKIIGLGAQLYNFMNLKQMTDEELEETLKQLQKLS
ncbi:hypothetical protein IA932_01120 [Listeria marthii]|uniref:hypothetical protein n=1 Tax=Listeria marthii TaxID=529731 RepID=UPI0018877C8B|nr:hypothetical protein [Listeria marthii]MBF2397646.1 hypothetical protein [Listeria marthii]MBF2554867.1 hypothetical protein [Listeria marthii]